MKVPILRMTSITSKLEGSTKPSGFSAVYLRLVPSTAVSHAMSSTASPAAFIRCSSSLHSSPPVFMCNNNNKNNNAFQRYEQSFPSGYAIRPWSWRRMGVWVSQQWSC